MYLAFGIALFIYNIFMFILFYYFLSKSAVVNLCSVFSNLDFNYSTEQS